MLFEKKKTIINYFTKISFINNMKTQIKKIGKESNK